MKLSKSTRVIMIICSALVILFLIIPLISINFERARLHYNVNGEKINVTLTKEETEEMRKIIKTRSLSGASSCGYSSDVSVSFGMQYFCFAKDGCSGIVYNLIPYNISGHVEAQKIFEKYGGCFPCS